VFLFTLSVAVLILLFIAIICDEYFVSSLVEISFRLKLSEDVAGELGCFF